MRFLSSILSSFCLSPAAIGSSIATTKVPWNYGPVGHLKVAKATWNEVLRPGDIAIDATCGNGHDSLSMAHLCLTPTSGNLHCIDIQPEAIESTQRKLRAALTMELEQRVCYHIKSHETFPDSIPLGSVSLICYNLGYLPGKSRENSRNTIITKTETTIKSIRSAINLLKAGGMLSITAYPGHEGGEEESKEVSHFLSTLSPLDWRVYAHSPLNRPMSPILYLAYRIDKLGRESTDNENRS